MATNYIQPGDVVQLTFAAAKTTGNPVLSTSLPGVMLETITAGGTGSVQTTGVFDLEVVATAAITQGTMITIDGSDVLGVASGDTQFGYALEAMSAGTNTIKVLIKGA